MMPMVFIFAALKKYNDSACGFVPGHDMKHFYVIQHCLPVAIYNYEK